MLHKLQIGVVVAGALLLLGQPTLTMAAPTEEAATCSRAKLKAAGLNTLKVLKCYGKAAKDGVNRDSSIAGSLADCIAEENQELLDAFAAADAEGGCATDASAYFDNNFDTIFDGLPASILNQLDKGLALTNGMGNTIGYRGFNGPRTPEWTGSPSNVGIASLVAPGATESLCGKKQFTAMAVLSKKLFFCERTAVKKNQPHGGTEHAECTQKAIDSYQKKFDKTLTEDDCINTADGATLAGYLFNLSNVTIPNMPRFDGCGNGLQTNGMSGTAVETCDDGNLEFLDACPDDCTIDTCNQTVTASNATLHIGGAGAGTAAVVKMRLDYPEGEVHLPGTGFDPPSVTNLTIGSLETLDVDHAAQFLVSSDVALGTADIATLEFDLCTGGTPIPAEFPCTVVEAFGPGGTPDLTATTTCSVTIP